MWQEYKVIQIIHDALAKFNAIFRGVSPTYRFPSLNRAIAPRSANSALALGAILRKWGKLARLAARQPISVIAPVFSITYFFYYLFTPLLTPIK